MMKCFIASAFGHDDVDAIYERCVVPALRKLSVTPLRVDRVEHNQDIDKKIFELLNDADFVIADLTYARPSVYYEAGYAAGKTIPVIYTARSDHFKARDADPQGNLRVHFDLQMRNIIGWKSPDRDFTDRLLKRLEFVLRPLMRDQKRKLKLDEERRIFNSLPVDNQLGMLHRKARDLLRARSFERAQFENRVPTTYSPMGWEFYKREYNACVQAIELITTVSTTKQFFRHFSNSSLYYGVSAASRSNLRLIESHFIVASLNSVPSSRVTESLTSFHRINDTTLTHASIQARRGTPVGKTYVHIIDGIKSTSEFEASFRKVIDEHDLSKTA